MTVRCKNYKLIKRIGLRLISKFKFSVAPGFASLVQKTSMDRFAMLLTIINFSNENKTKNVHPKRAKPKKYRAIGWQRGI